MAKETTMTARRFWGVLMILVLLAALAAPAAAAERTFELTIPGCTA